MQLIQLKSWIAAYKKYFGSTISQSLCKVRELILLNSLKILNFSKCQTNISEEIKNDELETLIEDLLDDSSGKFGDLPPEHHPILSDALFDLFSPIPQQHTSETIENIRNLLNHQKDFSKGLTLFVKTVPSLPTFIF